MSDNTLQVKISALTRDFDRGMAKATATLQKFSDKSKQIGQQMTKVGKGMTVGLTVPLVAFAALSAKSFANFEKDLAKIEGLVGIAGDKVAVMGDQALTMASKFGKSGAEAAEALFFITSAGLRGKDAMDTLEASLKGSVIGLGDTKTVADLATSAMNAYGVEVLSAGEATDVMTAAVREGKLDATTLAGSMGRVLPIAAAMGVKFNEVGAAFASMSRTGTKADEAATQLRGILSSLLSPSTMAEGALKELGLSSEGLRQNIKDNGLLDTLEILTDKFAGNSEKAALVFGNVRALSGVLDLMGKNVDGTRTIFSKMNNTLGDTDKAFLVASQTADFKFNVAMMGLKNSFIQIGGVITRVFLPIVEKIGASLKSWIEKFGKLSPAMQETIVIIGGLVAALGPVLVALGFLMTTVVPGLITALGGLNVAIAWTVGAFETLYLVMLYNPITTIAVAIAALVAAFVIFNRETTDAIKLQGEFARINETATKSISNEKAKLAELLSIAKDERISKELRLEAIEELNKISPKYLGDLTLDKINTDKARDAIEKYNEALLATAIVKAAQSKLQDIQSKKIDAELKLRKEITSFAADTNMSEEKKGYNIQFSNFLHKNTIDLLKEEETVILDIIKANKENNKEIVKKKKKKKPTGGGGSREVATNIDTTTSGVSVLDGIPTSAELQARTQPLIDGLSEFDMAVNGLIEGSISNTFAELGNSIGEAMATGANVFSAVGTAILTGIGNFLGDLGKMMIQYGVAALAYSIASKALLNPITAGPAAVGLIAAGTLLTIAGGAISGALKSGSESGGSSDYSSGSSTVSSSSSSSNYGGGGSGGGTYVFEIAGTKLVGVLKNTLGRNAALGGSLQIS